MPMSGNRSVVRALTALLLAPVVALGGLLVTAPAHAQRIGPTFFGMHDSDWTTPPDVPVGAANLTTSGTYWRQVETSPGTFDFTRLDAQVAAAQAKRAKPMIVLGSTPRFYSANADADDYYTYMPGMKAWKRYVKQVALQYGASADYQIWPEPNIVQNWQGSPRQMAKLTAAASRTIKRVAGKAKVVSPAVALRLRGQRRWMVQYFKQRVGRKPVQRYVDAVAVDPFPQKREQPEDSFRLMQLARKQLAKIGVRKPFWNNEINYGVEGASLDTDVSYSSAKQQSFVIRTFALSAAARMQRTYWLGWFRTTTMGVNLVDADGNELAPARSYETVRRWLVRTNVQGCTENRKGLWTCTARKGRKEVRRIYWKPSGRVAVKLPRSSKRVENQSGGVDTTPPRRIRVTYRPVMVASRK